MLFQQNNFNLGPMTPCLNYFSWNNSHQVFIHYINNPYICLKNITAQLYFILGRTELFFKFFGWLWYSQKEVSHNHVQCWKSINITGYWNWIIPTKSALPNVNIIAILRSHQKLHNLLNFLQGVFAWSLPKCCARYMHKDPVKM